MVVFRYHFLRLCVVYSTQAEHYRRADHQIRILLICRIPQAVSSDKVYEPSNETAHSPTFIPLQSKGADFALHFFSSKSDF